MDSDLFNVAIVVLVVLAQLVGAVVTAWKKRQARTQRQGQGGVVIVDPRERSAPGASPSSGESSWGDDISANERAPYGDSEEDPEEYWEEHAPGELDQSPNPATPPPQPSAATPRQPVRPAPESIPTTPEVVRSYAVTIPPPKKAGGNGATSRARTLLGRNGLRQAILAQTILTPPRSARGLRR